MDHPLSHQVLVNRQIRTPLRGSLASSLLEENMQDLLLEPTDERGVVAALEGFTRPLACVFKARAISKHFKSRAMGLLFFANIATRRRNVPAALSQWRRGLTYQ